MFGSVEALRLFLDQPQLDEARATAALTDASAFICAETEQTISFVADDVELIDLQSSDVFLLRQLPVVSVTSVELLTRGAWLLLDAGRYRCSRDGIVRRDDGHYYSHAAYAMSEHVRNVNTAWQQARVVYSHGYEVVDETTPPGIWEIAITIAAARLSNPSGVVSQSLGSFSQSFTRLAEIATPHEMAIIRRYRSRQIY